MLIIDRLPFPACSMFHGEKSGGTVNGNCLRLFNVVLENTIGKQQWGTVMSCYLLWLDSSFTIGGQCCVFLVEC